MHFVVRQGWWLPAVPVVLVQAEPVSQDLVHNRHRVALSGEWYADLLLSASENEVLVGIHHAANRIEGNLDRQVLIITLSLIAKEYSCKRSCKEIIKIHKEIM